MQSLYSNIPYSPQYIDLVVDESKSVEDQLEDLLSQAQGEFLVLKTMGSISSLMKIVSLFKNIALEIVFETSHGLKVVLFNNNSDTVISSLGINYDFVDLRLDTNYQNHSQVVDLDKIYGEQSSKSEIESNQLSFEKAKKIVATPGSLTLIGSQSPLLFLLIQSKLSSETKELFYQKDMHAPIERIF